MLGGQVNSGPVAGCLLESLTGFVGPAPSLGLATPSSATLADFGSPRR